MKSCQNYFRVFDSYQCSLQDGNQFIILRWPNIVFFLKYYLLYEFIYIELFTRNISIFEI